MKNLIIILIIILNLINIYIPSYANTNDPNIRKLRRVECTLNVKNKIIVYGEMKERIIIEKLGSYKIGTYEVRIYKENKHLYKTKIYNRNGCLYTTIVNNKIYEALKINSSSIYLFDPISTNLKYKIDKFKNITDIKKIDKNKPFIDDNYNFFPIKSINNYKKNEFDEIITQKIETNKNGKIYIITETLKDKYKQESIKRGSIYEHVYKYYFRPNELWWYKYEVYYNGQLGRWMDEVIEAQKIKGMEKIILPKDFVDCQSFIYFDSCITDETIEKVRKFSPKTMSDILLIPGIPNSELNFLLQEIKLMFLNKEIKIKRDEEYKKSKKRK
jgi:hypothetical protein